jgi:vanillate/3-O-methylgallate O-demethylase
MPTNLQEMIDGANGDIVRMLHESPSPPYITHPVVAPEFSNWRDEQRAWREDVVLMDQTHHMDTLFITGPDAHRLIAETSITTKDFPIASAKQYVAVSELGLVIGDGIVSREEENEFIFVGRSPGADWLLFNGETGGYDVELEIDRRSLQYGLGREVMRRFWRFQIQGPKAWDLITKLHGEPLEQQKFFREGWMEVAGVRVRTLRHGMAGAPGLELWGPFDTYLECRAAILEAGAEFGIRPTGARSYATTAIESGWIPGPLPAIYTGDELLGYREWLPADSYEARLGIGGSYIPDRVDDYYLEPWELGYGSFVKFDHDFIGRDALTERQRAEHGRKVTFAWHPDDVTRILSSLVSSEGPQYKYLELPIANYATVVYDSVIDADDNRVGLSLTNIGYTANERAVLSLGVVRPDVPEGAELRIIWGEPEGSQKKPAVEPHVQTDVRVRVHPAPYSAVARTEYHSGWRTELKSAGR